MLRIIHTGRAYEVLDYGPILREMETCYQQQTRLLGETCRKVWQLEDKYAALKVRYWQQGVKLAETHREAGHLKACLFASQQILKATKLELESCQKSTHDTHGPQDPH